MPTPPSSITDIDGEPPIVHISDIHGYYADAQSALTTLTETDEYDPVVTLDESGTLHWADNNYVLVINGDVIDRGPANDTCLELVWRLIEEAPNGRVKYHIGNHEMAILLPMLFNWPDTYSTGLPEQRRREFLQRVIDGDVTAAYEGHNHTITHAGSNETMIHILSTKSYKMPLKPCIQPLVIATNFASRNELQIRMTGCSNLVKTVVAGHQLACVGLILRISIDQHHHRSLAIPCIIGRFEKATSSVEMCCE
jgi:hypothetical protein